MPVIIRRDTGEVLPLPEEDPERDPTLLDFVAEQAAAGARPGGELPTRARGGARRYAGDARLEALSERLEWLWGRIQGFITDAEALGEGEEPDHSGRARLVAACNTVLVTIARVRGELDPARVEANRREEAILDVLSCDEHAAAASAVLVALRALDAAAGARGRA